MNFILCEKNRSAELSYTDSGADHYRWYSKSYTEDEHTQIAGAQSGTYTTDAFTEKDLRYYYCEAIDAQGSVISRSETFYVSYTGLHRIEINTSDRKAITSKENYVDGYFSGYGLDNEPMTIKGRGSSSWTSMPKKGYTLKFEKKYNFLNDEKIDDKNDRKTDRKWILVPNYIDTSKLGNWFASYLGNNVFTGIWEPSGEYVDLVINGEYKGCYLLFECVKFSKSRIDLPEITALDTSDVEKYDSNGDGVVNLYDGSFMMEVTPDTDGYSFTTLYGLSLSFKEPDLEDASEGDFTAEEIKIHAKRLVNRLEQAIMTSCGNSDNDDLEDIFDLQSAVNWYIVNEIMMNAEASFKTSSYVFYNPQKSKFYMGPNWDFDRTILYRDVSRIGELMVSSKRNIWFHELMNNGEFTEKLKETWQEKYSALLGSALDALYDKSSEMQIPFKLDSLRWDTEIASPDEVKSWMELRIETLNNIFTDI